MVFHSDYVDSVRRNLRLWGDFGDVCWRTSTIGCLGALWGTLGDFGGKITLAYLLFTPDALHPHMKSCVEITAANCEKPFSSDTSLHISVPMDPNASIRCFPFPPTDIDW